MKILIETGPRWYRVGASGLFVSAFLFWLLLKPGSHASFLLGDALAPLISALLALGVALTGKRQASPPPDRTSPVAKRQQRLVLFFVLTMAAEALAALTQLSFALFWQQALPTPSLADIFYLSCYAWVFLFLLHLPTQPILAVARSKVLLDSLMILLTVFALSWYTILGPLLVYTQGSAFTKFAIILYPCCDLALLAGLLLVAFRRSARVLRPIILLCLLAVGLTILNDSVEEYQVIHNFFAPGGLVDLLMPLVYQLFGLAIYLLRTLPSPSEQTNERRDGFSGTHPLTRIFFWRLLLPSLLIPLVAGLLVVVWWSEPAVLIRNGLYTIAAIFGLVIWLRQLLAIREAVQSARTVQHLNRQLQQANDQLEQLATTDPLTALPNHRTVRSALEREVAQARSHGHTLSLLFFDADHFKQVNDTYGHAVGDTVLRELGQRVGGQLRAGDLLGRYGGEEFLVLLPQTNLQVACQVAERMRKAVADRPLALSKVPSGVPTTISVGVATFPTDATAENHLVELADRAMYWAKRLGRNQVRIASEAEHLGRDEALEVPVAHL